jgi:gamma-glutamyltranspeptidase/glutathione hydrolase
MNTATQAKGAVAAGHAVTAKAAATILNHGGNAFDAAISALLTACVCEPVLASLGGGGFMMARPADGPVQLVDFFCDTPIGKRPPQSVEFAEVFADFGTMKQPFHIGCGATATPGMIAGLTTIAERFGTLPMADLAAPAVNAARDGVPVTEFQAFLFQVIAPILTWTPEARALFAPGDRLLETGDRLVNPALAEALRAIGSGHHDHLRQAMTDAIDPDASHLCAEDFSAYRPRLRTPIEAGFSGSRIMLNPRPAHGGALVAAMLEAIGGSAGAANAAAAMAATDSAWRAGGIDAVWPDRTAEASGGRSQRGTTHISIIDAAGNAVAVTVSNGEGNGRIVPGCGFMMNNMLGEEDVNPDGFHNWTPGQRLASMMTPAIVEASDGSLQALGSGGSNRIRTAIFQVLVNRLAGGMQPDEAVTAPRLHFEKGRLDVECADERADARAVCSGFADIVRWPGRSLYFGGVHCVERTDDGSFAGAGDPRRAGAFMIA